MPPDVSSIHIHICLKWLLVTPRVLFVPVTPMHDFWFACDFLSLRLDFFFLMVIYWFYKVCLLPSSVSTFTMHVSSRSTSHHGHSLIFITLWRWYQARNEDTLFCGYLVWMVCCWASYTTFMPFYEITT